MIEIFGPSGDSECSIASNSVFQIRLTIVKMVLQGNPGRLARGEFENPSSIPDKGIIADGCDAD